MKKCEQCNKQFTVTKEDLELLNKLQAPEPKKCPKCRFKRRLNERNHRTLYTRKCDKTEKNIISQYHAKQPFPVYNTEFWWSDGWNAEDYAKDFDFLRSFFEQFKELKNKVPHPATYVIAGTLENSDYTNCTGYLKNCYLIAESDYNEECYYGNLLKKSKDLVDCSVCYEDELCYECVDCQKCYNLKFSQECEGCQDSYFLFDCQSCVDCIGCINLKHGKHMIFNKQYTKEEYAKQKEALKLNTKEGIEEMQKKSAKFFKDKIHRFANVNNIENSSGNHIYNAKNSYMCFDCKDIEDCRYCAKLTLNVKSSMDYNSWGDKAELVYQSAACGSNLYNVKFCTTCIGISDCEYSDYCNSSTNCFGCVGLNKKSYCILNKQYTKEEYVEMKKKIIAHMVSTGEYGEFFPQDVCPYGYNESLAQEVFPLTRAEALKEGFSWQDEMPIVTGKETVKLGDLPKDATGIDIESLAGQIIGCSECGRNYKLIKQELGFYKKMDVPVPQKCPNCRHALRMALRNPYELYHRKCAKCTNEFETSYAPERKEIILCEECHKKEVA